MTRGDDGLEAVREHRDTLKTLAESDLPANWIAQELLDAASDTATRG